jgi:hypothetical protein
VKQLAVEMVGLAVIAQVEPHDREAPLEQLSRER